jgi:hypothetical protein
MIMTSPTLYSGLTPPAAFVKISVLMPIFHITLIGNTIWKMNISKFWTVPTEINFALKSDSTNKHVICQFVHLHLSMSPFQY